VQKTIELPDGAAILLTVAKYEGPAGKKIQDEAVTPTVAIGHPIEEEDDEAAPSKGDEPLDKALQLLKAKARLAINPRKRKARQARAFFLA